MITSFSRNGAPTDDGTLLFHGSNFLTSNINNFRFYGMKSFIVNASNGIFLGTANNTQLYIRSSDGNVGIGNLNPLVKLDVEGSIRANNLDYTSTITDELRPVYADQNGVLKLLSSEKTTKYVSVDYLSAANNSNVIFNSGGYAYFNSGVNTLWIPINLPDNAVITESVFRIYNNAAPLFYFYLTRRNMETLVMENIAEASTTTAVASYVNLSGTINNSRTVVDNSKYTYFITATSFNWQGDTQRFANAKVGHTFK